MIRGKFNKILLELVLQVKRQDKKNIALENVKQISYMLPNLIKMFSFRKMT